LSQKDIAFDKLKLDTFEKRYQIYSATKALIELVLGTFDHDEISHTKIRELYVKLDESRFYFPKYICENLGIIRELSEICIEKLGQRNPEIDRNTWSVASERVKLREMYSQLPRTFERTLAFTLLTAG
jgi:hypothetical protein